MESQRFAAMSLKVRLCSYFTLMHLISSSAVQIPHFSFAMYNLSVSDRQFRVIRLWTPLKNQDVEYKLLFRGIRRPMTFEVSILAVLGLGPCLKGGTGGTAKTVSLFRVRCDRINLRQIAFS